MEHDLDKELLSDAVGQNSALHFGLRLRLTFYPVIPATPRSVLFDLFACMFDLIARELNLPESDQELISAKATFVTEPIGPFRLTRAILYKAVLCVPTHLEPAFKRLTSSQKFHVNLAALLPGAQVNFSIRGCQEFADTNQALSSAERASSTLPPSLRLTRLFNSAQGRVSLSSQHTSLISAMRRGQKIFATPELLPFRRWLQTHSK